MKETPDRGRVSSDDLVEAGVRVRKESSPEARDTDLLQRYRSVPNHAMFLFSSADALLDSYIRQHWWELDGLSADSCDIHVSVMQLFGDEDVYTQLDDVRTIPGLDSIDPTELPSLHVWSRDAFLRISLTSFNSESSLRDVFRLVFAELRLDRSPLTPNRAKQLAQAIQDIRSKVVGSRQQVTNARAGGDIVQVTHNYFGRDNMPDSGSAGSGSKQSIKGVALSGRLQQSSDASKAEQKIEDAVGTDADQSVRGQRQSLSLGKYTASGKWAVIGLVVVAIIALLFKLLAG